MTGETAYTTISKCRSCGDANLSHVLSLGDHLVNDFPRPGYPPSVSIPIDIWKCRNCTLVQQIHTPQKDLLYKTFYWYRSGVTKTMYEALRDIVEDGSDLIRLRPGDCVLDIGSNDGTLLRHYGEDIYKIGVEPAENLHREGAECIDILIGDFWDYESFIGSVPPSARRPKIITAIGMFYDLDDPNKFIKDIARVLPEDGVFISQLMCLKNMLNTFDLGNFAHEHLEFYSIRSLMDLFYRHGLEIFDVGKNTVNGESYRLYARKIGGKTEAREGSDDRLAKALALEADLDKDLENFKQTIHRTRLEVVNFIEAEVLAGKTVWGYGASTKGNTILQYYGLGSDLIKGMSERSPEKWGRTTVTGIPIYSEEEARAAHPDYFLVLPYAFLSEFVKREDDWRKTGGKFIVPLPEFRIV